MALDWRPMKARINPVEIHLKDLPVEGRDFVYSRETGELNESMKDVVQGNDYQVRFRLLPVGNAYSLQGEVSTSFNLQCSKCASELNVPVKLKMNELIVVEKPMAKGDHQGRANHVHELQDTGPDYIMLPNDFFRVPDYVHEMVALAEPTQPLCPPENAAACTSALEKIQRDWLSIGEGAGQAIKANPFQILEKMKLKG